MDWGTVFELLQQWLAPTGCIAMAIGWWRDRRLVKVRVVKENEGTYKQLYDDLSETTLHLSDQIRKVNEKIIVLEQALRKCYQCKYADRCPAVVWMRSGSLQRSVTGEIIFGKAPTTLTSLALKPGLLRTIGGLPAGMGVTEQHEGLDLRVESDGEGGVNVTAVSHARPEITVRETSDMRLESEEATAGEKQPVPSFWDRTRTKVLCCFVLLLLFWGLRRFKDKSRNN